MPGCDLNDLLGSPRARRPAVLEGRWLDQGGSHALAAINPISVLEGRGEALAEFPAWLTWHAERFPSGAAVGFLSYELARFLESLRLAKNEGLPDLSFAYYPRVERIPPASTREAGGAPRAQLDIRANFDPKSYGEAMAKTRAYLAAGDIYQANLTQQFCVRSPGLSVARLYSRLASGRAPFRAFLKTPERTIISNSPERFFRVSGQSILASPIKGTIARDGATQDKQKISDLLASAKDRAENVMIVDLLRNDLGRICRYESIRVQLWDVLPLPHLFHLVSHVWGTLRPEVGVGEILRALFPCGSVTGAPKIRAMEILAELERVPRGVSMGAIGIIVGAPGSAGWEMDFNVAIRTMTIQDDVAVFNVGGGIVYDSTAEAEYAEMMLKARPLLQALELACAIEPNHAHAFER